MRIDYKIKQKCVEMKQQGMSHRQIYDTFFSLAHTGMSFETFRHKIVSWSKKIISDENILNAANLQNRFIPHNATVQVNSNGEVIQAWIKQHTSDVDIERLLNIVKELPKVEYIEPVKNKTSNRMLEIPLFDMHFGINNLSYYTEMLNDILNLIDLKHWESIKIIVGQDLFHNDDFRGRTTKGTQIQSVDMEKAFADARAFYFTLIHKAIQSADETEILFSEGNHDETVGWFFFKILEQAFQGQAKFNDTRQPRKCLHWQNIFVGYGHCDDGRTSPKDIRCQFTIEFPIDFAHSTTREIHLGHMHTEIQDGDVSGVVVRRLSTANKTDDWHNKNGYVGNHKRFMLFEYSHDKLKDIHYV